MGRKKKDQSKKAPTLTIRCDPPEDMTGTVLFEILRKQCPSIAKTINLNKTYKVGWFDDGTSFEQQHLYFESYVNWKGNSMSAVIIEDDIAKKYVWELEKRKRTSEEEE